MPPVYMVVPMGKITKTQTPHQEKTRGDVTVAVKRLPKLFRRVAFATVGSHGAYRQTLVVGL